MKLDPFDKAGAGAAQPLPGHRAKRGSRGAIAALKGKLLEAWVGLYAPPPRRLAPLL